MAAATLQDNFEGVLAHKRQQGNYFAGSTMCQPALYPKGPLISRAVTPSSGRDRKSTNGHRKYQIVAGQRQAEMEPMDALFELGYMRYDSKAGEEDEALINNMTSFGQRQLSHTTLDSCSANTVTNPTIRFLICGQSPGPQSGAQARQRISDRHPRS